LTFPTDTDVCSKHHPPPDPGRPRQALSPPARRSPCLPATTPASPACSTAPASTLLIGDSLGNVIQGHDTTLPVTVADIAYHVAAVKRGSDRPFIIADMPFGSYQESPEQAFRNAVTLMAAGAQMVKLEGGQEMAATVEFLVSAASRSAPTSA
jgi:ketopantoate hydroxymethyltransferase